MSTSDVVILGLGIGHRSARLRSLTPHSHHLWYPQPQDS
jgi:hypothetical protein